MAHSLRSFACLRGFARRTPYALARGAPRPAPLAWLTRFARSLACGGFAPPDPLHARSRGPCAPLRSRGSLASLVRLLAGASPRRTPLHARSRGPSPRAARVAHSLRSFACLRGLRPPDPPTRSLAGPLRPAPLAWLTRFARFAGLLPALRFVQRSLHRPELGAGSFACRPLLTSGTRNAELFRQKIQCREPRSFLLQSEAVLLKQCAPRLRILRRVVSEQR